MGTFIKGVTGTWFHNHRVIMSTLAMTWWGRDCHHPQFRGRELKPREAPAQGTWLEVAELVLSFHLPVTKSGHILFCKVTGTREG